MAPACDTTEFAELIDMIGADGVTEMLGIFVAETRRRLERLEAGSQDIATISREMHTLKGAAGTVGAPWLSGLARKLEHAAGDGIAPSRSDLRAIEDGLETFLLAARSHCQRISDPVRPPRPGKLFKLGV